MMLRSGFLLLLSFGLLNGQADPKRFAASIAAFHTQDQVQPPPKQAILFIGSSIFRLRRIANCRPALLHGSGRAAL